VDINDITAARFRIEGRVKHTPLLHSQSLSADLGAEVYVKYELFQTTGSFKARGAFNKLLTMSSEERNRGVVAVSGGNHAQAVAMTSTALGVDSIVLMPENTPKASVDAAVGYGAKVELCSTIAECFANAERYVEDGRVFLHPFDDPVIIAGQGTVGLEIIEQLPEVTDVFVSIGGGGLASGVAVAVKSSDPQKRIWGVETVGADAMAQALAAGHPVSLPSITSIAKTLGAPYVTDITLELVRENLESVTVVTDREAVEAMEFLADRLKVLAEPAAACTLAAARRMRDQFTAESRVVLILCGGNVTLRDACRFVSEVK
jgi:threonine dehydratase